jgi:hypothetical protein
VPKPPLQHLLLQSEISPQIFALPRPPLLILLILLNGQVELEEPSPIFAVPSPPLLVLLNPLIEGRNDGSD